MVQGYFTLPEAAKVLGMSPDELKQMAQKNQIRSFQDRGTLRFRIQDIQELARRRGATSDSDLVLGEAPPASAKPATPKSPTPKSQLKLDGGPRTPKSQLKVDGGPRTPPKSEAPRQDDIFDFSLDIDEGVGIGQEILVDIPKSGPKSGPKGGGKSDPKKKSGSPIPMAGSDSDVKLVAGNDPVEVPGGGSDSEVKVVSQDSSVKMTQDPAGRTPKVARKSGLGPAPAPGKKSGLGPPSSKKSVLGSPESSGTKKSSRLGGPQPDSAPPKRTSRLAGAAQPADSGVRLVPLDADSDVKIVGAGSDEIPLGASPETASGDSDIRLEKYAAPAGADPGENMMQTEEINLDEEIRKQEAAPRQPQPKVKAKSKLQFPTTSPFELSDSDLDQPSAPGSHAKPKPDSSDFDLSPAKKPDSSDIELTPPGDSGLHLEPGMDESDFSLELPDESALTEESAPALSESTSGITLNNPVDAGISLEEGSPVESDIDFDLSLEPEATPKPATAESPAVDSSSEFELTIDPEDSSGELAAAAKAEASPSSSSTDSDSEFELTLDDSGIQGAAEEPQVKAETDEKDIFETDFEVPALDEDSGSQVAAIDTDLDSSDFDIALDDSAVEDEESGSQVVALDEEADEAAATVAAKGDELEETGPGFSALGEGEVDLESEEEGELVGAGAHVKEVVREKMLEPAPWGVLPVIFMLPCVVVMILVGLIGFELIQTTNGYKSPGFLTKAIGELIGQNIK